MRVLPCGSDALIVELDDAGARAAYVEGLGRDPIDGVVETVPAARTVLLRVADAGRLGRVAEAARAVVPADPAEGSPPTVTVPVRYDGDDLADAANHLGVSVEELVGRHQRGEWVAEFCGFAPGFAYLTDASGAWSVPRRDSPRSAVPPGSVALAGPYSAVYPRSSPGGWQLIGTTDVRLWNLDDDPPALITPGTRVRFEDAGRAS